MNSGVPGKGGLDADLWSVLSTECRLRDGHEITLEKNPESGQGGKLSRNR